MSGTGEVILVLGGTRSGKSSVAERLARALAASLPVTYVATGAPGGGAGSDPEWEARLAAHRARRPATWDTVELPPAGDLAAALTAVDGAALVDSLGTWLAGFSDFACPAEALRAALARRAEAGRSTVVVSEEVGLGVHPPTEVGRRFADALGLLNQEVASVSDRVLLVMAGRVLELPPVAEPAG